VRADIMDGEPIADGTPTKMAQPQKDGANMGSRETLANFLQWSRHHYPADRYFLVLWGHAYGLGYGRDHGDPMTLPEIREAIHEFRQPLEAQAQAGASQEWPKLDLLGANACAMSYAEAACELRSEVQYLVASEIAIPLAGWPYETILGCMSKQAEADPAWDMPPDAVGQLVADRYVTQFDGSGTGERGAMSVLNLNAADTLTRHVADLGQAILNVVDGTDKGAGERLAQIRGAFIGTAAGDVRPLVDLVDLSERLDDVCVDLRELSPHPTLEVLSAAARRLASFLAPGKETTHDATQRPDAPRLVTFVAQHKDLEGLHGIGIFAPFVTDERDLKRLGLDAASPETGRPAYDRLELAKAAKAWAPLVFDRLRAGLPEPVLAAVEGSGAGNRADRSAVMQMLASLDSTLDALDRRIAATQSKALANVPAVATAVPAVLEQSALNMLGKMQLLRHEEIDKMLAASMTASPLTKGVGGSASASSTPVWSGSTLGTSDQVDQTAHAFFGLERLIGKTERTIRRTLTNGTFGLGPGRGAPSRPSLSRGARKACSARRATRKVSSARRATRRASSARHATRKVCSARRETRKACSVATRRACSASARLSRRLAPRRALSSPSCSGRSVSRCNRWKRAERTSRRSRPRRCSRRAGPPLSNCCHTSRLPNPASSVRSGRWPRPRRI